MFRIRGNERDGYVVQALVNGEWRDCTTKFPCYDEASDAYITASRREFIEVTWGSR